MRRRDSALAQRWVRQLHRGQGRRRACTKAVAHEDAALGITPNAVGLHARHRPRGGFFAAEDADFVTGQVLYVSGGPHG